MTATRALRPATARALARVDAGTTPYRAARDEGIALSTIYRALARRDDARAAHARADAEAARRRSAADAASALERRARDMQRRIDEEQFARARALLMRKPEGGQ